MKTEPTDGDSHAPSQRLSAWRGGCSQGRQLLAPRSLLGSSPAELGQLARDLLCPCDLLHSTDLQSAHDQLLTHAAGMQEAVEDEQAHCADATEVFQYLLRVLLRVSQRLVGVLHGSLQVQVGLGHRLPGCAGHVVAVLPAPLLQHKNAVRQLQVPA